MKHSEWLLVGARVAELWPGQTWPPETMAAAYDLFAQVPQAPALQALNELCAEGREFAPAPGVLLSRTAAVVIASTPLLQDPDLTRPSTPEELERARRMGAALAGDKAKLVVATWLEFAFHAKIGLNPGETAQIAAERIKACDGRCAIVAARCRRPGLQSNIFPPMLYELCDVGRELFEAWRFAVDNVRILHDPVQQEAAL